MSFFRLLFSSFCCFTARKSEFGEGGKVKQVMMSLRVFLRIHEKRREHAWSSPCLYPFPYFPIPELCVNAAAIGKPISVQHIFMRKNPILLLCIGRRDVFFFLILPLVL